ncbi:hypothetical protein [Paenibacillus sp. FSL R10-2736]|uniref:hypothetical protein n=1 Tax=Paenibacillus sp. FSL R10-2736 TaxID=2954692 RepID=UPI0030FBEA9A
MGEAECLLRLFAVVLAAGVSVVSEVCAVNRGNMQIVFLKTGNVYGICTYTECYKRIKVLTRRRSKCLHPVIGQIIIERQG